MPSPTLSLIRSAASIAEVVGMYVPLKKHGAKFLGHCPFHSEKTPSFTVTPARGLYFCFGCSAGGDVFSFLMAVESWTFRQALVYLSERYSIPLDDAQRQHVRKPQRLAQVALDQEAIEWRRMHCERLAGLATKIYATRRDADRYLQACGPFAQTPMTELAWFWVARGGELAECVEGEAAKVRGLDMADTTLAYLRVDSREREHVRSELRWMRAAMKVTG